MDAISTAPRRRALRQVSGARLSEWRMRNSTGGRRAARRVTSPGTGWSAVTPPPSCALTAAMAVKTRTPNSAPTTMSRPTPATFHGWDVPIERTIAVMRLRCAPRDATPRRARGPRVAGARRRQTAEMTAAMTAPLRRTCGMVAAEMPPTAATGLALALTSARRPSRSDRRACIAFRVRCVYGAHAKIIDVIRVSGAHLVDRAAGETDEPFGQRAADRRNALESSIARTEMHAIAIERVSRVPVVIHDQQRIPVARQGAQDSYALRHDSGLCPILHDANARVENGACEFEQTRPFVENDVDPAQQHAAQGTRYSRRRVRCHSTTFAIRYAKKTMTTKSASAEL